MSASLTAAETNRVINLLSRLSSPHDGERASAGLLVTRLLNAKGLTWDDLLRPRLEHPQPQSQTVSRCDWREAIDYCLALDDFLTEWEFEFLRSIGGRRSLTDKQFDVLTRIASSVARRRAAS